MILNLYKIRLWLKFHPFQFSCIVHLFFLLIMMIAQLIKPPLATLPKQNDLINIHQTKTLPLKMVAVNEKDIQSEIQAIHDRENKKKAAYNKKIHHLTEKIAKANQVKKHLQNDLKAMKKRLEQQKKAAKKQHLLYKKKQAKARKKALLKKRLKQLNKEALEAHLYHEANALAYNRYQKAILQAIAKYWIIPNGADKKLACRLMLNLSPEGKVLSVKLLKSSGNPALDRSARAAVFKASPLPIPTDSSLKHDFQKIYLTVKPHQFGALP